MNMDAGIIVNNDKDVKKENGRQKQPVAKLLIANLEPIRGHPSSVLSLTNKRMIRRNSEANVEIAAPLIPMLGISSKFPATFTIAAKN